MEKNEFLSEAVALAVRNVETGNGGPFGAVIVRNNAIIARGVNRVTSDNDPTAHAEMVAIREACRVLGDFQLTGCAIYSSCEPCPMCLGAIYWARLDILYFAADRFDAAGAGFDDSLIYEELKKGIGERTIPTHVVALAEKTAPFEAWKRREDTIAY